MKHYFLTNPQQLCDIGQIFFSVFQHKGISGMLIGKDGAMCMALCTV